MDLGSKFLAEEQKCQAAIVANPASEALNGRLIGLQRARDIAMGHVRELEEENRKLRAEARLNDRAAYLNGINVCMKQLRGQTEVAAVLPALIASWDRAVELHNAALSRAREIAGEEA